MTNSQRRPAARRLQALLPAALLALAACGTEQRAVTPDATGAYPLDDTLRLNHIQVLGSHNSYHLQPRPELLTRIGSLGNAWAYLHLPLDEQFASQGIRQLELDVFADPDGGLYANRAGMRLIQQPVESGIPELDEPGFKALHVQDLDFESTCWTFVDCLHTVKGWSDAHPGHLPIMILVEAKDDPLPIPVPDATVPIRIGAAELDALDAEIRSVFPPEQIITPDEVRGAHTTLRDAILTDGWPTLGQCRGRVIFALDNGGRIRDAYVTGHESLRGRILFTDSPPNAPEAAFRKLNNSIGDFDEIQAAVAAGFIVRTRADADTTEARNNDTRTRDAAIASGAQFVSTDYPVPDPVIGTGYFVAIPDGMPARCNPIIAPPECSSLDVENPDWLHGR